MIRARTLTSTTRNGRLAKWLGTVFLHSMPINAPTFQIKTACARDYCCCSQVSKEVYLLVEEMMLLMKWTLMKEDPK
jgi:hypothetical protein